MAEHFELEFDDKTVIRGKEISLNEYKSILIFPSRRDNYLLLGILEKQNKSQSNSVAIEKTQVKELIFELTSFVEGD